jgi:hypothetical protein
MGFNVGTLRALGYSSSLPGPARVIEVIVILENGPRRPTVGSTAVHSLPFLGHSQFARRHDDGIQRGHASRTGLFFFTTGAGQGDRSHRHPREWSSTTRRGVDCGPFPPLPWPQPIRPTSRRWDSTWARFAHWVILLHYRDRPGRSKTTSFIQKVLDPSANSHPFAFPRPFPSPTRVRMCRPAWRTADLEPRIGLFAGAGLTGRCVTRP